MAENYISSAKIHQEYTGQDLKSTVFAQAESSHIKILKKAANSLEKMNVKLNNRNLKAIQTGTLKIKIQKANID